MRNTIVMTVALATLGAGVAAAQVDPNRGTGARPGNDIGTGQSLPTSTRASNINAGDTRSVIAPRLPDPQAQGGTPDAYLAAAERALARGQTGAAQEALERAETRLLDRSVEASLASTPDADPRVRQVSGARQALANRDMAAARSAIQAARSGGMAAPAGAGGVGVPHSGGRPGSVGGPPATSGSLGGGAAGVPAR